MDALKKSLEGLFEDADLSPENLRTGVLIDEIMATMLAYKAAHNTHVNELLKLVNSLFRALSHEKRECFELRGLLTHCEAVNANHDLIIEALNKKSRWQQSVLNSALKLVQEPRKLRMCIKEYQELLDKINDALMTALPS